MTLAKETRVTNRSLAFDGRESVLPAGTEVRGIRVVAADNGRITRTDFLAWCVVGDWWYPYRVDGQLEVRE